MDEIQQLRQEIETLKETLAKHVHTGDDGSEKLRTSIELPEGEYLNAGSIFVEGYNDTSKRQSTGAIVVGSDRNIADGSRNTQIMIDHLLSSNDTFVHAERSPLYVGKGNVSSGGTTMSQSNYSWDTNELAGAYVVVWDGDLLTFDSYKIVSNNATTITVDGTWSFSQTGAAYIVFMPVYFGSAQYPWRRLYTLDGLGGGIRFGLGMTNGGQKDNGLLYMDNAGDLYWRNKAGSSTKLN